MSVGTVDEVLRGNHSEMIRDLGPHALGGGVFHYSVYRGFTRFLGMDGVYGAEFDTPVNWVQAWNAILKPTTFPTQTHQPLTAPLPAPFPARAV